MSWSPWAASSAFFNVLFLRSQTPAALKIGADIIYVHHVNHILHDQFNESVTSVSTFHLICIAVDRHQAICNPLYYSRKITMSVAVMMVCVSWSLAAVYTYGVIYSKAKVAGLEDLMYHYRSTRHHSAPSASLTHQLHSHRYSSLPLWCYLQRPIRGTAKFHPLPHLSCSHRGGCREWHRIPALKGHCEWSQLYI